MTSSVKEGDDYKAQVTAELHSTYVIIYSEMQNGSNKKQKQKARLSPAKTQLQTTRLQAP